MLTTCHDLCSQWSLMPPLCFPVAFECMCVCARVCYCWQVEQTTSAALVSALQSKITSLTLENQELANKLRVSSRYAYVQGLQLTKPVLIKFYRSRLNQVVSTKSCADKRTQKNTQININKLEFVR